MENTLDLKYPSEPRIQSTAILDDRTVFLKMLKEPINKTEVHYKPNEFTPTTFKEKRRILFWRNREEGRTDPICSSGRLNFEHYQLVKTHRK
jgi:hypothetical protein